MSILLGILTFVLIIVSILLVLIVLMQRAKNDGGMGAAMGGGVAEATFGADTGNVLSKATINLAIAFFILAFGLYLGRIYQRTHATPTGDALPSISAPVSTTPAGAGSTAPAAATAAPANATPSTVPQSAPATPAPEAGK
ncbi:MAG TPA: preprotein translocase subunit SecG [Opitutus sp.]|nr:preprotein translocase subunit SecG [Opitutus sp.]